MANTAMQEQPQLRRSTTTTVHVLAQTPSDWGAWSEHLAMALAPADAVTGRTDSQRWHVELQHIPASVAEAHGAAASGRTRWVVFLDSPARYLAAHLAAAQQVAPQELLSDWRSTALPTLGFIHRLRSQCVVFDSEETAADPAAVARWLSGWLGEDLPEDGWPVTPAPEGLLAKLAGEFVQTDRQAMALWSELLACCSPLPGSAGESPTPATQPLASGDLIAQAQALMAAAARVPALEAAQQGLQKQLESGQRRLAELEGLREQELRARHALDRQLKSEQDRLDQARKAADQAFNEQAAHTRTAQAQAQEAQAEAELLLTQLHQVQEELESLFLQQQSAGKSLAVAQAELTVAQQELSAARQEWQAEQQRSARLESERSALAAQVQAAVNATPKDLKRLQAEKVGLEASLRKERAAKEQAEAARKLGDAEHQKTKATLEAEAKDAKEEADLLLVQLHYVQEELETHFLALQSANQELTAAKAAVEATHGHLDGLGFRVYARQHEVTASHTERPHCELDLSFSDVTLGPEKLARVAVRLLEHEGRPGLALVALPDLPLPVSQWAADGEDGRGPYMLFIPSDAQGRERLAALGTRNWQTLRGLTALVQQAVAGHSTPESPFWPTVAARLCAALDAFPARLRYDAMTVQQEGQAIAVQLEGVCFGSRALPPLALNWTPDNRASPLTLLRTDEHVPCLAAWPVGHDGVLAPELVLPVAREASLGSRLRWWAQLLPADRDLAMALVDTLAAVPALLPQGTDAAQRKQLVGQAVQLRSSLQRSLNLSRWARRLRHGLRGQRT